MPATHGLAHSEYDGSVAGSRVANAVDPISHTQSPIVTGTSVVGLVYKDGVMLATDTLASYGSLARFRDQKRLFEAGTHTVVGGSGDISDLQHIEHIIEKLRIAETIRDDGHALETPHIYQYLSKVMYGRRSKNNPLWNSLVVAGVHDDDGNLDGKSKPFLGYVDLKGTTYQSTMISTGFGSYLAVPILRKRVEGREQEIDEEEAVEIINECMRVLFYRDARSLNKIQRAKITAQGTEITEPYELATNWSIAEYVVGYGGRR
ncbi:proteasome endopeptidase complex, beta subunit [Ramicandelaber brevisporus]|nr:proteasome endopeptidase complex, beta subunit [Ramicandelaber brevisporus]